jgi:hypothetical protein
MNGQLELEVLGGRAERSLARRRAGEDDLPWGTLAAMPPEVRLEARRVWTNGVFTEYASAAAFASLTTALVECGAPIDLVAAAADFAVDETAHVALVARLVMELGGAVPYEVDLQRVSPVASAGVRPEIRAAELAIRTSCVGEALSVGALGRSRAAAEEPLVRGVLARLLVDEGPHAQLGGWLLEWLDERLSSADREHLARVALDAVAVYAPLWARPTTGCATCAPTEALGALEHEVFRRELIGAVRTRVVPSLARHDIQLAGERLEGILAR